MPTFLTENMVFFHVPKTGGTWITQALVSAGVPVASPDPLGDQVYSAHGHAGSGDVAAGDRFSVAFVRHPLDWWRSYWAHRMRAGWQTESPIDTVAASEDFNVFATRVLDHHPGHFGALVRQFVGPAAAGVDFVGRFEHLVDDTCAALRLSGERVQVAAIRAHPPENVNDYGRFHAVYRPHVAARMAEAERETIERFYADDPLPLHLIDDRACSPWRHAGGEPSRAPAELQLLRERNHSLERALERSRRAHDDLSSTLARTRGRLDQADRSLQALRASHIVRTTRPLRVAYYRARRVRPGRWADPQPPAPLPEHLLRP